MIDETLEPAQEPTRFAVLPAVAIDDKRISHAAFRVLAKLASYSDRDGWAWPRQSEIAEALGMSRTTAVDHIGQLEQLGYIEVERRFYEHGGQRSSRYRLVYDRWSHRRQSVSEEPTEGVGPADREGRTGRMGESEEPTPATRRRPETTGTGPQEQDQENRNGGLAQARPVGNARVQRFIDETRRLGHQWPTNARDAAAIKATNAEPEVVARAFWSLVDKRWGTDWQQRNASVRLAIEHLPVYERQAARDQEYNGTSRVADLTNRPDKPDLEGIDF